MITLGMQEEFVGQPNEWGNISPEKVVGLFAKKDSELVRQLRRNWEGKEAAVRRVVQAWNRFPLRRLQVEGKFSIRIHCRCTEGLHPLGQGGEL
jgi:hypothetical protein